MNSTPTPTPDQTSLRAIATELRNLPRACLADPRELVTWLNGRANRIDDVATRAERPAQVEAVSGPAAVRAGRVQRRSIATKCGRRVVVEVRGVGL